MIFCARNHLLAFILLLACLGPSSLLAQNPEPDTAQSPAKRIALSFDDAPRHPGAFFTPDRRSVMLIAALDRAGVEQAVFFVNPCKLAGESGQGGEERIMAYVAAGHVIANHSCTHPHLRDSSVADYLADIDQAQLWLKDRKGARPWFRFPFLDEGGRDKAKRDALRAGLAERGLVNGYVTVDGSDWNMEALVKEAVTQGKTIKMEALRALYIETMVEAANYYDQLARKTLGRSPAHVLLLHETDLAALYIADLVAALRADGWEIISADQAYADPIAARSGDVDVPAAQGTLSEALAWEKGLPAPRWYERNDISLANRIFAERVLGQSAPVAEAVKTPE